MGCLTENGQSVKKRSKAAKEALVELVEKPKQKVCMYEKKKKFKSHGLGSEMFGCCRSRQHVRMDRFLITALNG